MPGNLDLTLTAARGSTTPLRVFVDGYDEVASVAVQASTDRGRTWRALTLRRVGDHWETSIRNMQAGTVALRGTAKAAGGASVTQRVLDAYGVR